MEKKFKDWIQTTVDRIRCCKVIVSFSKGSNQPIIKDEESLEIQTNSVHRGSKNASTQNAKYLLTTNPVNQSNLKIKNLSLTQENETKIESTEEFLYTEVEDPECQKLSHTDFEIIQVLGKGSFGEVFLVKMTSTGQYYAMKVLQKEKIFGENLVKYARTERDILMRVKHPFIVKLNYAFQSNEKLYLVLDYCSGGNLGYYLRQEGLFSEDVARFYLCEIILALEELHSQGIIYRDLKPDNVLVDGEGHALLTDFGLSKRNVSEGCPSKSFCGSVAYLAPEVIRRTGHGKAVDWYLLGVLLYEMIVGVPPFYSVDRRKMIQNIEKAKIKTPDGVSSAAKDLIKKLLKRDSNKRIGSSKGAEEIKSHGFFAGVDWASVLKKETKSPIVPRNSTIPAFIPKFNTKETSPEDIEARYLHGWYFASNSKNYI
jgi:serine/threonine protein kinase